MLENDRHFSLMAVTSVKVYSKKNMYATLDDYPSDYPEYFRFPFKNVRNFLLIAPASLWKNTFQLNK